MSKLSEDDNNDDSKRVVCRSNISVKLILTGVSLNKRRTVIHIVVWRTTDRNRGLRKLQGQ